MQKFDIENMKSISDLTEMYQEFKASYSKAKEELHQRLSEEQRAREKDFMDRFLNMYSRREFFRGAARNAAKCLTVSDIFNLRRELAENNASQSQNWQVLEKYNEASEKISKAYAELNSAKAEMLQVIPKSDIHRYFSVNTTGQKKVEDWESWNKLEIAIMDGQMPSKK